MKQPLRLVLAALYGTLGCKPLPPPESRLQEDVSTVSLLDSNLNPVAINPKHIRHARVIQIERPASSNAGDPLGSLARVGGFVGGRSYLHQNLVLVVESQDPKDPDGPSQIATRSLGWPDNAGDNGTAVAHADVTGYSGDSLTYLNAPKVIGRGYLPDDRVQSLVPDIIAKTNERYTKLQRRIDDGSATYGIPEAFDPKPIYQQANEVDPCGTRDGSFNCQSEAGAAFREVIESVDPEGRSTSSIRWEELKEETESAGPAESPPAASQNVE